MKFITNTCIMKNLALILIVFLGATVSAKAELHTQSIEYKQGDTVLEGFLAYDKNIQGKRPGVIIVHQWKGLGSYEKKRAEMLASLGYTVFAIDIYGKGIRADNPKDASALATKYKSDRPLLRERAKAGLAVLRKHEMTDPRHVAAIGYCFGGTTVLELARSSADLDGVVSFHGALGAAEPKDTQPIKCKVLALHGADDPFVPPAEVSGFEEEMRQAKADWQLVSYGGAVHSFTDWNAGSDNSKGAAYNEKADKRSWETMKNFFAELFK
jgi:dienelactone hydrolase